MCYIFDSMTRPVTLLLPGLHPVHNARPHTFRAWAAQDQRACVVEQHDWARPLRGDWLMQLDTAVLQADDGLVLVAEGLGCWLVAAWAQVSSHTERVSSALLINPLELNTPELQTRLPSWQRIPVQPLPFAALVVGQEHSNDNHHAMLLAQGWHAPYLASALTPRADNTYDIAQLAALCDTLKEETHGH